MLAFRNFVRKSPIAIREFHHGCATGFDAETAHIIRDFNPEIHIVAHPPIKTEWMAIGFPYDEMWEPKDYLDRNQDIVNCANFMAFGPKETSEVLRSGTWSTYRRSIRNSVPGIVFWPNGTQSYQGPKETNL